MEKQSIEELSCAGSHVLCFLATRDLVRGGVYEYADSETICLPLDLFNQINPQISCMPLRMSEEEEPFVTMEGETFESLFLSYSETLDFLRKLAPSFLLSFAPFANDLRCKRWGMLLLIPKFDESCE